MAKRSGGSITLRGGAAQAFFNATTKDIDMRDDVTPSKPARHPAIESILRYFTHAHLPARLQEISRPFCELAEQVADRAPSDPETTVALRKLLEAKDAAVRAGLAKP